MQVGIFAVGRMKKGPERELVDRYFDRFTKSAPALGLSFGGVSEIVESRLDKAQARMDEESNKMLGGLQDNARLIVLDERGKSISSRQFADDIAAFRDDGARQLLIAIGGPDGHGDLARERADKLLSFGSMTWPHQIARILLAEQLYRATTILSNHPYHRD